MKRRLALTLASLFILWTAAPSSAAEVVVGAIVPLSGPAAPAGKDIREGIEMALEIVNGEHDLDLPFARTKGIQTCTARPSGTCSGTTRASRKKPSRKRSA